MKTFEKQLLESISVPNDKTKTQRFPKARARRRRGGSDHPSTPDFATVIRDPLLFNQPPALTSQQ